ncbi:hypothetical protein JXL83_06890 [candidate division WOR-3 bacterium]|nr:hypothetical protein [candidate division WOR-3 bacterium]
MKRNFVIFFSVILPAFSFGLNIDETFDEIFEYCGQNTFEEYRCEQYIVLAQYVQSLGNNEAIAALREYAAANEESEKIIILTRMLFKPKDNTSLRRPLIGGAIFFGNTDYEDWPSEPIEIINGVPFLITMGYCLGGSPETSLQYLEYCAENGEWNEYSYSLKTEEEMSEALNILLSSPKWNEPLSESEVLFFENQIVIE